MTETPAEPDCADCPRRFMHCYMATGDPPEYDKVKAYGTWLHQLYDPGEEPGSQPEEIKQEHFPFITRRVETIRLLRLKGDKRSISLDIDSSKLSFLKDSVKADQYKLPPEDVFDTEWLIPIGIFRKSILLDFDSRDSRRNLNLAARCISYVAGYAWLIECLPGDLKSRVTADTTEGKAVRGALWRICIRDGSPGIMESMDSPRSNPWAAIYEEYSVASDPQADRKVPGNEAANGKSLWERMCADRLFKSKLELLYENYFPFVVVHRDHFGNGERHMIKFAVTWGEPAELWAALPEHHYGIIPVPEPLYQYGVLEAHSEHLRVLCPPGVEFGGVPELYLPSDTPQVEVERLRESGPTYVFHRDAISIKRHTSSYVEPQIVRFTLMPDVSEFLLPTILLLCAALLWFVACVADWQFDFWSLGEVTWTTSFPVSVGFPVAIFLWTLRARRQVEPLRAFLLNRLFSWMYVTMIGIGVSIITWSAVARLAQKGEGLSNFARWCLGPLTILALMLLVIAALMTGLLIVRLLWIWSNQRDLRLSTRSVLAQQRAMEILPWRGDNNVMGRVFYGDAWEWETRDDAAATGVEVSDGRAPSAQSV